MGAIEDHHIYGLQIRESATDGSDFTNPDADYRLVFLGEDGLLHARDSAGTVTNLGGTGLTNPMTTQDDIIVGGAAGVGDRLGKGTDGQVLTVDPTTHHLVWATPSSGFSNPMTTKGDVIVADTGGTALRKAVGTDGQVLTADAASTGGIKWAAAAGGGTRAFGLDRASFDATYGDDFDGASLDAKWSRHNQTSGQETYQAGGLGSILRVAHGATNAAEYIYQTAPNGTNETWEASCTWDQETATGQMFALLMVSSTGTGVAALLYDNSAGLYLGNVTSHAYASILTNAARIISEHRHGQRVWLKLRKASGVYGASYSFDGQVYSREITGTPGAFTPARVGIGRILGTDANDRANWHWFDKTA